METMDDKIKLTRSHISLPDKWIIKNQTQYETAQYLMKQERLGFKPAFLVTFHYYHPDENRNKVLTLRDGKTTFKENLWKECQKDKFIRQRRLDVDGLIEDTKQIRNVILKELYGIKRLNQTWKYEFPNTLFFYERGKSHIKFHTHLLLPRKNLKYDNIHLLEFAFNERIRRKRKCFSNWKEINIQEVSNVRGALSYCNKETTSNDYSIDYFNSNPIKQVCLKPKKVN